MCDQLRRHAHPGNVRWFVVDHECTRRCEVWRQPVEVTQLRTHDVGENLGIAIDM
jgi:hypothetical protein